MRKIRMIIRIITGFLVILTLVGIVILIMNEKLDWLDTSYEIIAFSLGAAGMIMAVVAQVDSYQQEKLNRRVIEDLTKLNREADEDEKVDAEFQAKMDEVLKMDRKIYKELRKKEKKR